MKIHFQKAVILTSWSSWGYCLDISTGQRWRWTNAHYFRSIMSTWIFHVSIRLNLHQIRHPSINCFSCFSFFSLKTKLKWKIHLYEVLYSMEEILNLLYKRHNGECCCIWCVFVLLGIFICKIREWVEHPISLGGVTDTYVCVWETYRAGLKIIHTNITPSTLLMKIKLLEGFEMG